MDNQRLILFIALSFVVLLLWEAWQRDYGPAPEPAATTETRSAADATPPADLPGTAGPEAAPAAAAPDTPGDALPRQQRVTVTTDLLRVEIDTRGGDIRRVELLDYPATNAPDSPPFVLMNDRGDDLFVAQSGLRVTGGGGAEPTHHATFEPSASAYTLAPGADRVEVPLTWRGPDGVTVTKRYTFFRDRYVVDLAHEVQNDSTAPFRARQYRQLQRHQPTEGGQRFIYTYTGGVIYSEAEKYEKISFDDMAEADLSRTIEGGWAAMIQHYFLGAWIPRPDEANLYYTRELDGGRFVIGLIGHEEQIAPGAGAAFTSRLFVGPKIQERMADVADGLELTVDYGFLTVISKPLFWLLDLIHDLVGNWGWAIVLVTVLIKLAFYKLSETSYKSMANMRKLAPRLQALKERYGDDKQKLNQAMMDLYRTEKINPLGGCLPILVQIPVFIALYWVLLESVELRQADFILWLTDLSTPDPYYVLPLIMGVTMFAQQKLNPAPMDPVQAKVMMILPVVFTVFFAFFPSGLVLYWVVNNILSIAQQWVITRRVEAGAKA